MKKLVIISVGILTFTLNASAQKLYTTTNDFAAWGGNAGSTVSATTDWDYDGDTINAIGNLITPGGAGGAGALSITWANTVGAFNVIALGPGQGGNQAFMSVIDPGSSVAGNTMAAYSGLVKLNYTLPDANGGSYMQLGILLQYAANGYYGQFFPSSGDTYLGNIGGYDTYEATIPYTITAGAMSGFGFQLMWNSNYQPLFPFYVDNIRVVPEPGSMALMGLGALALVFRARRRS